MSLSTYSPATAQPSGAARLAAVLDLAGHAQRGALDVAGDAGVDRRSLRCLSQGGRLAIYE